MIKIIDELKPWHVLAITIAISIFFFLIAMVGSFLMGASMADMATNTANGNIRILAFRTETAFNQSNNYTQAELERLNTIIDNHHSETLVKQAAYDNQIWQLQDNIRILNTTNNTIILARLDAIDRAILATNQTLYMHMNGTMQNFPLNFTNATNQSGYVPDYFARYENLTCYWDLRRFFGVLLDPEWLCSASQVIPEYQQWYSQSCACAREAGINV